MRRRTYSDRNSFAQAIARSAIYASLAVGIMTCAPLALAQSVEPYHRTLIVSNDPVALEVDVAKGDLQILYGREGQVAVSAVPRFSGKAALHKHFDDGITLVQNGNSIKLVYSANSQQPDAGAGVLYKIDVPYRTVITSTINDGNLTISGVMGPVWAKTGRGDIKVSYVSKELVAQAGFGNLDLQMIGAQVDASADTGNISCVRAAQGVRAETQDGDITLMEIGSSIATVKKGRGRINVGGVHGSFLGATEAGEVHVKAVPYDNWQLDSQTGTVRIELPPEAKFEVDASSNSGEITVERNDTEQSGDLHHLYQAVNGGGARIHVRTASGGIVIR